MFGPGKYNIILTFTFFLDQTIFKTKSGSWKQIILDSKFLGPKICLDLHFILYLRLLLD